MARSVEQAFEEFLSRLTPLESERQARARHRSRVESSLSNSIDIRAFREVGSFSHGTGIRSYCDVDLLVSIKDSQPESSDTALGWVKSALSYSFPSTNVRVSRPAVVVEFAGGSETWEIIPAFKTARGGTGVLVYEIPAPASGWIDSAPIEHIDYVNEVNSISKIQGAAKKLARLAKAWKYYNEVPVSSFYLEMRAAQYMKGEGTFIPIWDICGLLEKLEEINLAPMNDPRGAAGRFYACATTVKCEEAASKLRRGASRARKALDANQRDDTAEVFRYLTLLFGDRFPSRY